jgi:SAM-dependent methyltransferase
VGLSGNAEYDYAKGFGSEYHGARQLPEKLENWISNVRADKLRSYIQPADRVLEYGVGFGWNLARIECAEKVGFDLTPGLRSAVESKGICFVQDEAALPQRHFNKIICHHVLEHVRSPVECARRIGRMLQPSGELLLFVPFEREAKYRRFSNLDKAHHLYSWTLASLARLLEQAGFSVGCLRVERFRFDRFAAVLAGRLRGGEQFYRLLRWSGMRILPEYEIFAAAYLNVSPSAP